MKIHNRPHGIQIECSDGLTFYLLLGLHNYCDNYGTFGTLDINLSSENVELAILKDGKFLTRYFLGKDSDVEGYVPILEALRYAINHEDGIKSKK